MKSILAAFVSFGLFLPVVRAAEPDLMTALQVMGYGYKVKVTVNGYDAGVEGGKSEGRRLFNKASEMAAQAPPAARAKNFVLVPGVNDVVIEYTKVDPGNDSLEITMQAENYPQPVLTLVSKTRQSDKLALKVRIDAKPAADFKPIVIKQ